jgi:hypothetical protein
VSVRRSNGDATIRKLRPAKDDYDCYFEHLSVKRRRDDLRNPIT